jgi:hypothetical protein
MAIYDQFNDEIIELFNTVEDANDELSAIYYRGLVTSIKIQVRYMAESMNLSKI